MKTTLYSNEKNNIHAHILYFVRRYVNGKSLYYRNRKLISDLRVLKTNNLCNDIYDNTSLFKQIHYLYCFNNVFTNI